MLQTKVLNTMSLCNSGYPSNVLAGAILLNVLYDATIGLLTWKTTSFVPAVYDMSRSNNSSYRFYYD